MSELANHLELYGTIWDCLGLVVGLFGTLWDWDMNQGEHLGIVEFKN